MFSVALSVVDMLPAGVSLTSSVAIVEIIDNDEALVPAVELGFDPVTYRVGEGSGTVELRVSVLSGVLMETITLSYETSDGSAVAGTDYTLTTGTLTLSSGATSFTFTVKILEDLDNVDVELAGVFSVALSVVDMLPAGVSLTSSVAIVEIIDNDEALVPAVELGFDPVTYRVGEGSGTVELRVSVLSGVLMETITLSYATSDGSAVAGDDYALTTGTLTLSSGISSFTFTVKILEDLDNVDVELAGVFSVALSVVDMLPAGVSLTSSVAIVEIIDNDEALVPAVELGFDPVTYRVGEGSGTVELRVSVLSGVLMETITLSYATSDGSAVAGDDYALTTGTLTLSSGATSFTFTVKILEDLDNVDVELAGVFSVALSVVDMLPAGVVLTSSVAIVEIIDNDEALVPAVELGFDPVTYRVGEGSGTVELRVSVLSGVLMETITLSYATSDGSAVAGDDYALTTGTLTLSSGISSFTFTVKILEDLDNVDVELAGVFSVALSVVDMLPAGVVLTSSVAIVEIIDNDQPLPGAVTATLSLARVTLLEGETATVEIRLTGNAPADLTFTLVQISGTATGTDYTLTPIVALIPAGANRSTVSIFAVNDSDPEAVESFTLRLESISTRVAIGTTGSITVTIPENDKPAGITVTPITPVTEGDQIIVAVVLDAVSSDTVTVILVDAFTGSAEAGGVDYTLPVRLSEQITIGETRAIFRIDTTLNDFLYEGDETVDLEFSVMGSSIVVPATALIRDADQAPTVSFAPSQPTTVIESSSVGILVRLDGAQLVSDLTVEFEVDLASTATSADYVVGSSVVIAAGEPFVMLTLTAASDRVYDGGVRETVELRLTGVSGGGLPGITLGSRITHVVSIIDAQIPPSVSFAASQPTTVAEGSSVDILVELDGALTDDEVVVDFTVSGTADEGVDYDSPGTRVTILPGEVTALISLVARADNRYDGGMTETVELVLTAASGGVTLGDSMTHAVTIIDNEIAPVDPPAAVDVTATLSALTLELVEGATETLEIRLSGNAPSDLTFTLVHISGTAVETDYTLSPTLITIGVGDDSATVLLEALVDTFTEEEESFVLGLRTVSSRVVLGVPGTVTVTIPANIVGVDPPEVVLVTATLRVSELSVSEGDTTTLNIYLSEPASEDVTLTLTVVSGGSAVESVDYEPLLVPVVIRAGLSELTVSIRTIDDELPEETKLFELILSVVDGPAVTGAMDRVMVTILDNDEALVPAVELGFDPVTYRVGEGSGTVELRVSVLSGVLMETITLSYETSDGSAVAGDDYALTTGTLTLSSGISSFTFTVKILEDLDNVDVELAGVFSVALSVVDMLPAGVSLTSSVAIVEIIDNDEALVPAVELGFDPVTYRVGEGSGTVELRVSVLSGVLMETITLSYETSDGSAVAGDDYALTTGTLTLSSGISSFTFTVKILEDLDNVDVELAGVFSVALSVVDMLPAGVSLTSSVAIVEIIDNDEALVPAVELGFDPVTYRVGEGSGTVELRVSVLSGVLMETITLSYETSDGSAVAGDDYALTTGTLTLSSGIRALHSRSRSLRTLTMLMLNWLVCSRLH